MSKKIICFLLSNILILCSVNLAIYGVENSDDSQLKLLQGLNIVCGLDENKIETPISKSTFINYILNITNEYNYADYYEENALLEAERMGIISSAKGIEKNDTLSADEAITIAVRLLGYGAMAQENGGYPAGYMNVASRLGLLKDVTFYDNITYNQAISLLANVIESNYSQFELGQNGNIVIYEGNVNALAHFRGIYFVKGVVTADSESDLYSDAEIGEGRVKVGDEIYYEGNSNIKSLLGHYVQVYLKETKAGFDEVVYALDKAKDVVVINAEDVVSVEENICTVKYYKDETSARESKLQISADAAYALNGVSYPQCVEDDFTKDGTIITLVENDGDRKYDYVNLERYETMIVSAVSVSSMKIHNEYTFDEDMGVLDLSKYSKEKIHIFKNDSKIELSEIEKGDILSIYRTPKGNDGEMKIYAENNQFEGTVESYSKTNSKTQKVVIDGITYELSNLYIDANLNNEKMAKTIKVGRSYTFGCDTNGKIVYAKDIQDDEGMYGYAVKMIETDESFDTKVAVKLFMDDGSWKTYTLSDKVKWNGSKAVKASEIYGNSEINGKIPGLIGIKLNSKGEINALETPIEYTKGIDKARLNTTGEVTANYRYNGTTFSNYYYMTSQTKVFIIPDDITADEALYEIGTNTSFKSDNSYTFEGYNRDEYYVLDMVVSKRPTDTIQTVGDTLYMVRSVGTQFDEAHGLVPYVNVASNTYAGVSLCGEEGVFDGITEGDLIKMRMNSDGLIDNCSVIYSVSNGIEKLLPTVNERHSASSVVKGIVTDVDVDGGKLLVETTEEMAFMVSESIPVLIYDAEHNDVTVGNLSEVEKDDFVNISLSRSLVNMLAVYRGLK